MRILYHHRTLGDGAEGIHIREMVRAFRALGHEVLVLGAEPGAPDGPAAGLRGWRTKLKALLPGAVFELATTAYNAPEFARVQRAIARFKPVFLYKRHARFDVAALLAARRRGVPTVLEVNCLNAHGSYERFEPTTFSRAARHFERRALRTATLVAAVSSPLAGQIREAAAVEALVLPNGVDTERFDPAKADRAAVRRRHGLEGVVIGWAGILREWHGLDLLLQAVSRVHGVQLLLVGDGPARAAVEAQARTLGIAERVVVTGRVAHEQVPSYIAAMDVAVVADERTGVASPMKLLEYMAMGRAVVAPDLANIRDVVSPDLNGLLFPGGDHLNLSRALAALAPDADLRAALGRAARHTVTTERQWTANAGRVLTALEQLRAGR